ncbi:group III truncated hemoglobin [Novosphingobium sp. G106]|uniref:group III truncated hemoglobin n=1 Tax=Novosphingobium sp. G106 TaxID=2849500 RepID=UPI001C2D1AF8|nr:group III truncated hemoglobin [Novosphingobium sp. G106]MBV1686558.1 group III truncated hemoglobin [Novosphingobium sp. G106]
MPRHSHHDNPNPTPAEITAHAAAARARKRAEAEAIGIDDDFVAQLVESFYARIRADALLGPIFAARIADWPLHRDRMKSFWRSILHNSGEFAGNPMAKHLAIPGLERDHFAHWLNLFYATLRELERHPAATRMVGTRARMIADSLLTGIATRDKGIGGARAGADLPQV